jgi:cell division protein FtsL
MEDASGDAISIDIVQLLLVALCVKCAIIYILWFVKIEHNVRYMWVKRYEVISDTKSLNLD